MTDQNPPTSPSEALADTPIADELCGMYRISVGSDREARFAKAVAKVADMERELTALRAGPPDEPKLVAMEPPLEMLAENLPDMQPDGMVLVPSGRYKELINCCEDMASGKGGWAWEDVIDEHRAMLAAASSGGKGER